MKKSLLLLVSLIMTAIMMAGNVTPEEAMRQAQSFLQKHSSLSNTEGKARSKATAPRLTMVKQIKGVYLFNVEDDGGYVIVSSDDRTVPILGYSDSGAIDPDNIPANMQAWLQGYADEIAWLQQHNSIVINDSTMKLPRRAPIAQTNIAPLVTTTWDQDAPYNNMCPEYSSGSRSATGCVATAMAQVMNYHKWPTAATTAIFGYTTESYNIDLTAGLPATTLDWANMQDSYSENATGSAADAVAKLMQYCGYSVQMDYGPESGSNTDKVATALKNYFDYKTTTTQFVSRSYYTATKWANLIYHELANNRPVVYGGMSSGGGHEFVCDGYKYENNTDFFHINWGWGGTSDNYFVLSALDPDQQGIGGSTSDDGFHYGQDAVIGIQPSTGTGTIANITPNVINLTVNSMTPSANPAYYGTTVNITLNVTNNSADDYDGDIYLGNKYVYQGSEEFEIIDGSNYTIASGETKDIVIPFRPYATGTYNLVYFLPNATGSYETTGEVFATLTVENPVTSEVVPVYGHYCDELSRSLFVIPSTDLEEMTNGTLNGVTFYSTDTSADWGDAEFDVYLSETTNTTISAFTGWSSLTKVYSGSLSITGGEMTIIFDTPFTYGGSNLMVGINQTKSGDYDGCHWVGSTVSGASYGGYNISLSQQNFLPKTSFDYTPGEASAVARPTGLTVRYTGGTTAEASWTSTETAWDIDLNGTVIEDVTNPYTLTNLELATAYTVKVRAKNGSDVSDWSAPVTFTTDLSNELCQIGFELTDSYDDGWNGASIQVVDVITGIVIGSVTNASGGGKTQTLSLTVPDNRDINFVWVSGSYDSECSYVVYDVNGEEIFSGSGAMSSTVTYHVDCTYTPTPTDLSVIPYPTSANVTWAKNDAATSYNLRYRESKAFQYGFETADPWAVDDFPPCTTYDGDGVTTYGFSSWNFTNQKYTGACIAFRNDNDSEGSVTSHSGDACGVMFNPSDGSAANDWFVLPEITIQDGDEFSFWAREITDDYGAETINVGIYGNTDGTFASTLAENLSIYTETWTEYKYDLSAYAGQTIRLAINCVSKDIFGFMFDDIFVGKPNGYGDWVTVNDATTPYVIDGLTAESCYEVQVQGVYADGASAWTETVVFTTPSSSDKPVNLTATDIADHSATLGWSGYQDIYNVRYRTAGGSMEYAFDDFENGNQGWTDIADGIYTGVPYSGTHMLVMGYATTSTTQYVITPELSDIESGSTLKFYQRYVSSATTFNIGFSSTTADIDAFTWGEDQDATDTYTLYSEEIPAGTKYIAIRHTSAAQSNALLIDDFGIYNLLEEGEWQTVNNVTEPTLALTGLASGTPYEWQVQGILTSGTTPWSALATFTTTGEYVGITNLTVDDGKGKATANGTWYDLSGRPVKSPTQRGIYIRNGKKYVVK